MPAHAPATTLSGLTPGYHYLALYVASTGIYELFILYVPAAAQTQDVPLLAAFHGFGVSPLDIRQNTTFDDECEQRGWYLFAPFSLVPVGQGANHFSSIPGQEATFTAFDWVLEYMAVDPERIYAVGHSMGAGMAASFAARHRSAPKLFYPNNVFIPPFWVRAGPTIAALAVQSGTFDIADVYQSNPQTQAQLTMLYGGDPQSRAFHYQRCSTIQLDPATNLPVPGADHKLRNLVNVPTQVWYATGDPETYLVEQTIAFANELDAQPGSDVSIHPVASNLHSWETMDEGLVCDWFEQQVLDYPSSGSFVVDREARYSSFDVKPSAPELGLFDFEVQVSNGRMSLTGIKNIDSFETSLEEWPGFPTTGSLEIEVGSSTAPVNLFIRGFAGGVTTVLRNGVPVPPGQNWVYYPETGQLLFTETEPGIHFWSFD